MKDNPDIRQQVDTELRKALGLVRKEVGKEAEPAVAPVEAQKPAGARSR